MKIRKLSILGGGPAGLSAAYFAHRSGISFELFESNRETGGNCRTICDGGFSFDTGAHRLHSVDGELREMYLSLLGDDLLPVGAPSSIFSKRKFYDFPLTPLDIVKKMNGIEITAAAVSFINRKLFPIRKNDFRSMARNAYGDELSQKFILDYSKKLWGVDPSMLHPKVAGKRLKGLDLRTFLTEAFRSKNEKTRHIDGDFFYPRYGIGQLFCNIHKTLPETSVRLNTAVERICHRNNRIHGIQLHNGNLTDAEEVISSLPVSLLLKMLDPLPPQQIMDLAKKLQFRHLFLVHLKIARTRVTEDATIYFPDPQYIFTRVTEPRNRSRMLVPSGYTSLVAEIPYFEGDETAAMNESGLIGRVSDQIVSTTLINKEEIIGASVFKVPYAYPVLSDDHAEISEQIGNYLSSFVNLKMIGRSGAFAYTHIHDHIFAAKELISTYHLANINKGDFH